MTRMPGIRRLFRLPASSTGVPGDVEEEIAFHLEERERELQAQGLDPAAARAEALREFGDLGEARAELEEIGRRRARQVGRASWWSDLGKDIRYAGRGLVRSPGFTVVAVLTLALGIGATTAIFTVVDGVLLRPLGVADPEELVVLTEYPLDEPERLDGDITVAAPANLFDWRARSRSFESMAYFTQWPGNVTGEGDPQEVQVQYSSADLFSMLGVQPLLGRTFLPEEDDDLGGQSLNFGEVAVLSHHLWQSRYGGQPGAVGSTIRVDGTPYEIVGVMGPDFRVLDRKADLWIPMALAEGNRQTQGRFITALGRLSEGATVESAQEELSGIARALEAEYPDYNANWGVSVSSLRDKVVGQVRPALMVLLGAVGMLLLIASTNVASLLLGRATARKREIAVRLSLGATRGRIVRQLLTESLVLSFIGGAIGVAAAVVGTRALVGSLPESVQLPRLDFVTVDARVLFIAIGITALTGLLFGLAPALVSTRQDLQATLRDAGRGQTSGRRSARLRGSLVIAEVALALMLLVGAGLLLRSFQKLQAVETGMREEGVLTMRLSLGSEAYGPPPVKREFVGRLLQQLEALPGVQAVGTVSHLPLTTSGMMGHLVLRPDRPPPEAGDEQGGDFRVVGGDYFQAQGIRLSSGRLFDERDHVEAPAAFVINQALARELFPGEDPVGQPLAYPWPDLIEGEVIGVVEDIRAMSVTEEPRPAYYRTFDQWTDPNVHVLIRTVGDPMALAGPARDAVGQIDPDLPVASVRTMTDVFGEATARSRMSSYLLAAFAGLALLLAAIGLYGVVSYGVAQRRGEIGVRVALGADGGRIVRLVVKQGMILTTAGLAIGLLGAFVLTRLLQSLLFGVTTTDATTFVAVPMLLAAVALLASYLPASRAAKLDAATALRSQ